jgi:hypothetical protein
LIHAAVFSLLVIALAIPGLAVSLVLVILLGPFLLLSQRRHEREVERIDNDPIDPSHQALEQGYITEEFSYRANVTYGILLTIILLPLSPALMALSEIDG